MQVGRPRTGTCEWIPARIAASISCMSGPGRPEIRTTSGSTGVSASGA
jgi:hypothetical protein